MFVKHSWIHNTCSGLLEVCFFVARFLSSRELHLKIYPAGFHQRDKNNQNFVSKFIFAGILHEGMIGDELFDLKFSLVLFGNLNPACDFVCLQIDGNIIPERKFVAGVIVEEILKHIRNGLEIRMRFPFQNPISERSIF